MSEMKMELILRQSSAPRRTRANLRGKRNVKSREKHHSSGEWVNRIMRWSRWPRRKTHSVLQMLKRQVVLPWLITSYHLSTNLEFLSKRTIKVSRKKANRISVGITSTSTSRLKMMVNMKMDSQRQPQWNESGKGRKVSQKTTNTCRSLPILYTHRKKVQATTSIHHPETSSSYSTVNRQEGRILG